MVNDFDISQYLDSKEMDELLSAIGHIAKAKGMSQVSKDTGLGRESLYKAFAKGSKPKFDTVLKVLNSLDIKLKAVA